MTSRSFAGISWLGFIFFVLFQEHVCLCGRNNTDRKQIAVYLSNDGIVEILFNGQLRKVCYDTLSEGNWKFMNVVCRHLQRGPPQWIDKQFEWIGLPWHWSDWRETGPRNDFPLTTYFSTKCTGRENSPSDCDYQDCHSTVKQPKYYLQAKCLPATSADLQLHLVRKIRYEDDGILVTNVDGIWGPICTRFQNLSRVFCPMIGQVPESQNETENYVNYIYADPVVEVQKCKGDEKNLSHCNIKTAVTANEDIFCDPFSFAYVECKRVYLHNTPDRPEDSLDYSEIAVMSILGILICLSVCECAICYKKATRLRSRLNDDNDSEDPDITVDEARLRYLNSIL